MFVFLNDTTFNVWSLFEILFLNLFSVEFRNSSYFILNKKLQ